ncbi:MAG: hypothetical protein ACE5HE_06460 [Phycisphaerae bacterium]
MMAGPIDGNRRIGPQGPQGPIGPADAGGTEKAQSKKVFDLADTQRAAEHVERAVRENFNAVRGRIQDGLRQGLTRDQILTELTRAELKEAFGPEVSERMVASVARAVTEEPSLSMIFSKLFEKAGHG